MTMNDRNDLAARFARANDHRAVDAALRRLKRFHAAFVGLHEVERSSGLTTTDIATLINRVEVLRGMVAVRKVELEDMELEARPRDRSQGAEKADGRD